MAPLWKLNKYETIVECMSGQKLLCSYFCREIQEKLKSYLRGVLDWLVKGVLRKICRTSDSSNSTQTKHELEVLSEL